MEAHDRSERLSASPPLFKSEFLNFFSRVHPAIPAVIFVPVIVAMEWLGADRGFAAWELLLLSLAGVAIWTLTEYWLHRLVFHWEPDNAFGRRMHFIIHGVHHAVPKTTMGKQLREQHMRHHFQDHRFGYGVSSPLWDVVFRTLPRKRNH